MYNKTLQMKRALRTALIVLLLDVAGMGKGYAYDFVKNGVYYNITSSSNPKTVEVTFKNDNHQNSYAGDIEIPSSVSYNGITYSVNRIGNDAFFSINYDEVTSVSLPNSIIEIGGYAFFGCRGLNAIEIPNSVLTIGFGAFTDCSGLTSITIPESVETIEGDAFNFCTNLETVNFNAINCRTMGTYNQLQSEPAFNNCTAFFTLNIGENVQIIPSSAFEGCMSLSTLSIPENVHEIQNSAFKNCTALTTVCFNAINCTLGGDAFEGCINFTTLNYGDGVQYVDAGSFRGLYNLRNISIPSSVTSVSIFGLLHGGFYGTGWFNSQPNGVLYLDGWCLGYKEDPPTGLLEIRNGTKGICSHAFSNSSYLDFESIVLPTSLLYIGYNSFYLCNKLKGEVAIPNSVLSIGWQAFYGCNSISSLILGSSVLEVGERAFSNCTDLISILSLNPNPPTLNDNPFDGISHLATLFVPCGSQYDYFYNWNIFEFNNIHEDCTPRPIIMSSNITGGTITPSVSQATSGQEVLLTVTPDWGMALSSLTVYIATDPTQIIPITPVGKTSSIYSFVMPPYAVAVSASFEHGTTYSISIIPSISGGSITASTSSASAGELVILNVRPNSGYELQVLSVYNANDASQTVPITNNTFIMPSFNVMISASFNYTSVDENGLLEVSIYPNPTIGRVTIEADDLKHITISNMFGQVIYEDNASGNEFVYDFSQHSEGFYLIRIETANSMVTKRVAVTP